MSQFKEVTFSLRRVTLRVTTKLWEIKRLHLREVYHIFPTDHDCIVFLEEMRWKGVPRCPYCQSPRSTVLPREDRYHCNGCNVAYSVTVRTVFHQTHLPLQKWYLAILLIVGNERDIPIRQLACDLQVSNNTASFILARIGRSLYRPDERRLLQDILRDASDLFASVDE